MKKIMALTATIAVLTFAGSAHAVTDITLGATSSDVTYTAGGTLTPNLNLASLSPSQLVLTGDAEIVSPAVTVSGSYVAPDGGTVYGNNFLAVIANPTPAGTAVLNLAPGQHVLAFTWGSVDPFNTLTITTASTTFTITGSNILSNIPGLASDFSDTDVSFYSASDILSATFTSSGNSFEVANFESAVPLPAALPLLGSALIGAGALARRRRTA